MILCCIDRNLLALYHGLSFILMQATLLAIYSVFYNNCRILARSLAIFILSISGHTNEIYNLCDIDATSESRKFEKSICHFLTNRKRPFVLISNKRARRIMNLPVSN